MEPSNSTITATGTSGINPVPFDISTPITAFMGGAATSVIFGNVLGVLGIVWTVITIISYLFCIGLLFLYVYASTEKRQLKQLRMGVIKERERIFDQRFKSGPRNSRMSDIEKHIISDSPNDWKLAIIEADIVLDEALKKAGYAGVSLGERLKSIAPSKLNYLDDAWQAHKVRNQIAHGGSDFVLTRRLAEDTIKQYKRVFSELGIL